MTSSQNGDLSFCTLVHSFKNINISTRCQFSPVLYHFSSCSVKKMLPIYIVFIVHTFTFQVVLIVSIFKIKTKCQIKINHMHKLFLGYKTAKILVVFNL